MMATRESHMVVSGGRLVLRLPDEGAAVELARQAVHLLGFSVFPEVREDAQLVVSELVSNGLEHGQGGVTLSLAVSELGRLSGEVVDDGNGFEAQPHHVPGPGPRGWGLTIVATLAERWGIQKGTTRVWFAMPLEVHRPAEGG
jgi:anti-sigma regulatory factor (Ser/Thr protein kinase)